MRLLAVVAAFLATSSSSSAFEPNESYALREVRGFAVLVHSEVLKHPGAAKEAMAELDSQLKQVCAAVPENHLAALKKIRIWIEWEAKKNGAAEFHVSSGWLKDNGYNPDKLRAVEINNTRNFVKWSRRDQPWMVLHELAHAYHFTVLGSRYARLRAAYEQAKDRKLYDAVARAGRKDKVKAYAMTNPAEYFAELSESYFGKNDFFPFTRDELKRHDPVGFDLMEAAWGDKKEPMARVVKTILSVAHEIEESNPPVLVVTAVGQVPTGGWTGAKLTRRTYKKPPADGIYEYDLTAVPPDGAATQALSRVKATDRWKDPPKDVKGFKVYGVGKGVKTVMVKGR